MGPGPVVARGRVTVLVTDLALARMVGRMEGQPRDMVLALVPHTVRAPVACLPAAKVVIMVREILVGLTLDPAALRQVTVQVLGTVLARQPVLEGDHMPGLVWVHPPIAVRAHSLMPVQVQVRRQHPVLARVQVPDQVQTHPLTPAPIPVLVLPIPAPPLAPVQPLHLEPPAHPTTALPEVIVQQIAAQTQHLAVRARARTPVQTPVRKRTQVHTLVQTPARLAVPAHGQTQIPDPVLPHRPTQVSVRQPTRVLARMPGQVQVQMPVPVQAQTPVRSRDQVLGPVPIPVSVPDQGSTLGQTTVQVVPVSVSVPKETIIN